MSNFFDDLMESVQQMDEIHRGERQPSREFTVDPSHVIQALAPPHDFVDVESRFKSFKEL
jgi:hypothetical protein